MKFSNNTIGKTWAAVLLTSSLLLGMTGCKESETNPEVASRSPNTSTVDSPAENDDTEKVFRPDDESTETYSASDLGVVTVDRTETTTETPPVRTAAERNADLSREQRRKALEKMIRPGIDFLEVEYRGEKFRGRIAKWSKPNYTFKVVFICDGEFVTENFPESEVNPVPKPKKPLGDYHVTAGDRVEFFYNNELVKGKITRASGSFDRLRLRTEFNYNGEERWQSLGPLEVRRISGQNIPPRSQAFMRNTREFRTWTSADGNFEVEAMLLVAKEGTISLKNRDDEVIDVKVELLSKEDREYLDSILFK